MRIEATARDDVYAVWMTDSELDEIRRNVQSHRDDLIIQLDGYIGLCAFEIPQIQPKHVKRTGGGEHYRLRIPEEKDTREQRSRPRKKQVIKISVTLVATICAVDSLSDFSLIVR